MYKNLTNVNLLVYYESHKKHVFNPCSSYHRIRSDFFLMRHGVVEACLKLCVFESIKIAIESYPIQTERSATGRDIQLYSLA